MEKLITLIVEAEVPKRMIVKVIFQVEGTEPVSFHMIHFEGQNVWVASCRVKVPEGRLVSYKLFVAPQRDDLNVEHLSPHGWVDLHNIWEEEHTVVITKASYLKAYKPSVVTGFEDANVIFFNQINPALIGKTTLISMAGSGPEMNNWNHQKYVIGFGHGRSITAVKAKPDSTIEYKNVIGLEHDTKLWDTGCYTDYVNSLRWEAPSFVNKKVAAPAEGIMRLVTSRWGDSCVDVFDFPVTVIPSVSVAELNRPEIFREMFEKSVVDEHKDIAVMEDKDCDFSQVDTTQKKKKSNRIRRIINSFGKKMRSVGRFVRARMCHKPKNEIN